MIPGYEKALEEVIFQSERTKVTRLIFNDGSPSLIVKELNSQHPNSLVLSSFEYEKEILQLFECHGVVRFVDFISHEGSLYLITEDGGESLQLRFSPPLEIQEWIDLAEKIAAAIGEVHHEQIVHKDICPGNIVINDLGEVRLIDFGIASRLQRERQSVASSEMLEGALPYISPEQTGRMNRDLDYRSDYYSLGVTLYKLITGELPFYADDLMGWIHAHMALPPKSPSSIDPKIPESVSQVILKLLSKSPEDRYQSSVGILHDLELCRQDLVGNLNGPFIPGTADQSERFIVPQTVVGRENEIATLEQGFQKMISGQSELLLIGGYSGVGKSALVHEVHKSIVKHKGFFLTGKYEQYQRNVPFLPLQEAFEGLVQILLSRTEEELNDWRESLLAALGGAAQVIVDIIPSLELVIGEQPPAPDVESAKAGNRQIYLFKQFISCVASADHPLTLFIDDLQWCDYATLRLLNAVLTDEDLTYIYIIGTYRNNEVDDSHALVIFQRNLEKERSLMKLDLQPLNQAGVETITAATLHRPAEEILPLAEEIFGRTKGNPFFVRVMLITLFRNQSISFSREGRWEYDLTGVDALGLSDNVVDIMVDVVNELPRKSRELLTVAAVIGNRFDLELVAAVLECRAGDIAKQLLPILLENLVVPQEREYRTVHLQEGELNVHYLFQHDKIQQAAYSLLTPEQRSELHLTIGRTLYTRGNREEVLIDLVHHFNLVLDRLTPQERQIACQLNTDAGIKSRDAIAYDTAQECLETALSLLPDDSWQEQFDLSTTIYLNLGEVYYLNGSALKANELFVVLEEQVTDPLKLSDIFRIHAIYIFFVEGKIQEAYDLAKRSIELLDLGFIFDPTEEDFRRELDRLNKNMKQGNVEKLRLAEEVSKEHILIRTVVPMLVPAFFLSQQKVLYYANLITLNTTFERGAVEESAFALSQFAQSVPADEVDKVLALKFADMSMELCHRLHAQKYLGSALFVATAYTYLWYRPIEECIAHYERAYQVCVVSGDVTYADFSMGRMVYDHNLPTLSEAVELFYNAYHRINSPITQHSALRSTLHFFNYAGLTSGRESCDTELIAEDQLVEEMTKAREESNLFGYYVVRSGISLVYEERSPLLDELETSVYKLHRLYYRLTGTFTLAMQLARFCTDSNQLERVEKLHDNMSNWAADEDINIRQFERMMAAECHRLRGETYRAICCYEEAIKFCKKRNFREYLALSQKLLGAYYAELGKEDMARLYLSEAFYTYQIWGAKRVCEFLWEKYGRYLTRSKTGGGRSGTAMISSTTIESNRIDLASVITAAQALSRETSLKKLVLKFITFIQKNFGCQRIILLMQHGDTCFIEAEGEEESSIQLLQHRKPSPDMLPKEMVYFSKRLGKEVLYDHESGENRFADPYLKTIAPQSALMVPLKNREEIIGMLYLENRVVAGVFTEAHIEMICVLASQAAVSIENAQMYGELERKVKERTEELTVTNRELEKARREADRANQSKSDFLANMSHEIRTPMNAVLGFSEIMMERDLKEQDRHYLQSIYSSGSSLLTLINDILDLSKVEAGKLSIQYESFSLVNMLSEIELIFRDRIEAKGLIFSLSSHNIPPAIVLDETRVRQIVTNLLSNALKFTTKGGITITTSMIENESSADLEILVEDSGKGICLEDQQRIFQPFEQAAGQKVAEYGGTGLGLVITDRLCTMMNGSIELESEPGQGARFRVVFRDVKASQEVVEVKSFDMEDEEISFLPAKILIADAGEIDRELIEGYLESFDFTFMGSDFENVLRDAEKFKPDIIIIAAKAHESRGVSILNEIRESVSLRHIPIIAITASVMLRELELVKPLCDSILKKPLLKRDVVRELKELLPHISSEKEFNESDQSEMVIIPEREELEQLLSLAKNGFLDDIAELVDLLVNEEEKFSRFSGIIKGFTREFRETELITYLQKVLKEQ